MKTILILTGWTRGIGEGILNAYADIHGRNLAVIAIARTSRQELEDSIVRRIGWMRTIKADLGAGSETDKFINKLDACLQQCNREFGVVAQSILINNAAILGPIVCLQGVDNWQQFYTQATTAFSLNCVAAAMLSGWFLSQVAVTEHQPSYIVNISSGASQGPMSGAGVYSMTKAALNMLGKILLAEQAERSRPVKVIALSPGMIETAMQKTLREQPAEHFPNVAYFREGAKDGTLGNSMEVGRIIASLDYDSLENGSYHHIQELI